MRDAAPCSRDLFDPEHHGQLAWLVNAMGVLDDLEVPWRGLKKNRNAETV